jgi:hypothetical protein
MRNVHARDFLCCFCFVVSTLCSTRLAWLLLRLGTAVYYVAACPVSNRRISFAYIIRRERSPLSLAMTSSLIVNGGKMRVESSQIVGVLWIISVVVSLLILVRLSLHVCPSFHITFSLFGFSEYEHQLPLGSHTHSERKGSILEWPTHQKRSDIFTAWRLSLSYYL